MSPKPPRTPIPRRIRREALLEVGGKCPLPGCDLRELDFHHINEDRSDHRFENIIAICVLHHTEETRHHRYGAAFFRDLKRRLHRNSISWGMNVFAVSSAPVQDALEDFARHLDVPLSASELTFASAALETARAAVARGEVRLVLPQMRRLRRTVRRRREASKAIGPDICNLAGVCCFKLGQLSRATSYYQHGLSLGERWKLRINLATLLLQQDRGEEALLEVRQAKDVPPDSVHAQLTIALSEWEATGRSDVLIDRLRALHASVPGSVTVALQFARALSFAGHGPEALTVVDGLAPAVDADPARASLEAVIFQNAAAQELEERGLLKDGIRTIERLSGDPVPSVEHPLLRRAVERQATAIATASRDPLFMVVGLPHALSSMGTCLFLLGETRRALSAFRRVLAKDPSSHSACLNVLQVLSMRGRHRVLLRLEVLAAPAVRETTAVRRWVAGALLSSGRHETAVTILRQLSSGDDSVAADAFNLAVGLALLNAEPQEIRAAVDDARRRGQTTSLNHSIGATLYLHEACSQALPYLIAATEEDPTDLLALEFAGRAMLATRGAKEAEQFLRGTEEQLLAAGGSLAWTVLHLRRAEVGHAQRHLLRIGRTPWSRYDRTKVMMLLAQLQRGQPPIGCLGCRVEVP